MWIKPGKNTVEPEALGDLFKVRVPRTHMLVPAEGMQVPDYDPYWTRLLRYGDVVPATPPAQKNA